MFETYWLCELKFVKIKAKSETYEYICVRKPEQEEVYVPSLIRDVPISQIELVRGVEASDMLNVLGLSDRVRFDIDGAGAAYAYYRGKLHTWEIRRIERNHNKAIKKIKEDKNLTKRR